MPELRPRPFEALVTRAFQEPAERGSLFDLPAEKFHRGTAGLDLSVHFHGHRASTPLGPAAGPHTQMAQNMVLAWAGGCRILELKTVQINDRLTIPRPCIDMRTVGYNIEWSQELRLSESLEEYVKGALLIQMLSESGALSLPAGQGDTVYDMSVGYDLAGIRSAPVRRFLDGMKDASAVVARLVKETPRAFHRFLPDPLPTCISDTLTLSTFHGCPPDEIESIVDFLLREHELHCVVKFNPTLLGRDETNRLLHDVMGYRDIRVPPGAFSKDTTWNDMTQMVERLSATASSLELGFGVKFTNTLLVENSAGFLPAETPEAYLSGAPLHVLAMEIVRRFRDHFGPGIPVSFSGGIDRANFADAVSLGLVPVTVCTDLLRPGGYARASGYLRELETRMEAAGARSIDEFVRGEAGDCPRDEAVLRNTREYTKRAAADPRYRKEQNAKPPRKIGSVLHLFDCINCDKCLPACPNAANFVFELPAEPVPTGVLRATSTGWELIPGEPLPVEKANQIGNFADLCNDCGNCDVFCPEDGGPYLAKPRFFGSAEAFAEAAPADGFHAVRVSGDPGGGGIRVRARIAGQEVLVEVNPEGALYEGTGFALRFDPRDIAGTVSGHAAGEVDLRPFHLVVRISEAVLRGGASNWIATGTA
ncbi:MAG: glutamate synthase [Gemmatimonadota bacterium]|nr:glutamate synthase [Gemmatimonadota bacterium]MDP7031403.1 glutamate synthase [Gemmatimonadota bacterium]